MHKRIKERRKEIGLSQEALGKKIGLTKGAISQWEVGATTPSGQNLYNLADALGVSAKWLLTGEGNTKNDELSFNKTDLFEEDSPLGLDEVEVPYFREVEMAAGHGRTQVIENHGVHMRFSLSRLARAGVKPENAACATLHGRSMEPSIVDGSPIGIDKGTTHIIDGKIYALDHDGMLRVKRLYRMPLGRLRLVSDNAEEFPEEIYDPEEVRMNIRIIGRVFWWEVFD